MVIGRLRFSQVSSSGALFYYPDVKIIITPFLYGGHQVALILL